jgi:hypothetical protein
MTDMRNLPLLLLLAACTRDSQANELPKTSPAPEAQKAGPRSEGQGYTVDVLPPTEAKAGAAATIKVTLRPTGGYHVNKEFPIALTVVAPEGVDVPKAKLTGPDGKVTDDRADFEVAFTPKAAGDKAFTATFRFAVCTAETCDPKVEKLSWNVSVK